MNVSQVPEIYSQLCQNRGRNLNSTRDKRKVSSPVFLKHYFTQVSEVLTAKIRKDPISCITADKWAFSQKYQISVCYDLYNFELIFLLHCLFPVSFVLNDELPA